MADGNFDSEPTGAGGRYSVDCDWQRVVLDGTVQSSVVESRMPESPGGAVSLFQSFSDTKSPVDAFVQQRRIL